MDVISFNRRAKDLKKFQINMYHSIYRFFESKIKVSGKKRGAHISTGTKAYTGVR